MSTYAFFDVDETLIYPKSMFDFLLYWYQQRNQPNEYARQMALIQLLVMNGADRAHINRVYYRQFAGVELAELKRVSAAWYWLRFVEGALYKPVVVDRLRQLCRRGVEAVLVSGSMQPLLTPIAEYLGVAAVLCAELHCEGGRLSGELCATAIGAAKRERVLAFLAEHSVAPSQCEAFGDHISDLPMLEAVGWPTAVDPCPELAFIARQRGWPILITNAVAAQAVTSRSIHP